MDERVTTRIPDEHAEALDDLVDAGRYPSRSEAIRSALRQFLDDEDEIDPRPWRDA